jgi:hypothetical protein
MRGFCCCGHCYSGGMAAARPATGFAEAPSDLQMRLGWFWLTEARRFSFALSRFSRTIGRRRNDFDAWVMALYETLKSGGLSAADSFMARDSAKKVTQRISQR